MEGKYYPIFAFDRILAERWYMACAAASKLGIWTWKTFWSSPLSAAAGLNFLQRVKFMIKCALKSGYNV